MARNQETKMVSQEELKTVTIALPVNLHSEMKKKAIDRKCHVQDLWAEAGYYYLKHLDKAAKTAA